MIGAVRTSRTFRTGSLPPAAPAALLALLAGGCASLSIEMPRRVALRAGEQAEIEGALIGARTPVGGVEIAEGRLPPGLAVEFTREAARFAIRGVPSRPGRYEVVVSAWSYGTNFPGDRATAALSIDVVEQPPKGRRREPSPAPGDR